MVNISTARIAEQLVNPVILDILSNLAGRIYRISQDI